MCAIRCCASSAVEQESLSSCELDVDRWTFVYLLNARGSSLSWQSQLSLSLSLSRRVSGLSHFVVRIFLAFGIVWFVNPERAEELRNKRKQTKQTYVN